MPKAIELSGKKFGRLVAVRPSGKRGRMTMWLCKCDCGKEHIARGTHLTTGRIKSCGCFQDECRIKTHTTHGRTHTAEYRAWRLMIGRCLDPKNNGFKYYGERGIKICSRWMDFENFFADMGLKPSSRHSLDRKNCNGNYEPDNCRWATAVEQQNNKRNNRKITHGGICRTIREWERALGLKPGRVSERLRYGWSMERIISTPVMAFGSWSRKPQ